MYLHQAIRDYQTLRIPPPPRLERSDPPTKKSLYVGNLSAFHWELPRALWYIHEQWCRKKEQAHHGHVDPGPPDLSDYLSSLDASHIARDSLHKWGRLEKVIQISRDISSPTKESLLHDIRQGNREGVLLHLWQVSFAELHEEELFHYDVLLD